MGEGSGADPDAPEGRDGQYSYDQASVWGDSAIKSYCDRFDIEPEHTPLIGAAPDVLTL